MKRSSLATIVVCAALAITPAAANDLWAGLEQELKSGDTEYLLHKPIKNNRPAGFVYTNFRASNGTRQTAIVCKSFNPALVLEPTRQFPLVSKRSREVDIEAGFQVAAKHFPDIGKANAQLKHKGLQTVEVEFGEVIAYEIPEHEVPRGRPQEVTKECNDNVRKLIDASGFFFNKYQFWFIQKTLSTTSLNYRFNTKSNIDANASLEGIKEAVDVSGGVEKEDIESGVLNVKFPEEDQYYIGYVAREITRWKPVNLVSPGDHAEISLEPLADGYDASEGRLVSFEEALAAADIP